MSMFELSKWKGSPSALRRVALLSLVGAMFSVIGGCPTATRQPHPMQQEASSQSLSPTCEDGRTPADAGNIRYVLNEGFQPKNLCMLSGAQLSFSSDSTDFFVCISPPRGEQVASPSPFTSGRTSIHVKKGPTPTNNEAIRPLKQRHTYTFWFNVNPDCERPDGGSDDMMTGTLEVVPGGPTGNPPH